MGLGKYENVGKSQPVLIMINPIIFTRTRNTSVLVRAAGGGQCMCTEHVKHLHLVQHLASKTTVAVGSSCLRRFAGEVSRRCLPPARLLSRGVSSTEDCLCDASVLIETKPLTHRPPTRVPSEPRARQRRACGWRRAAPTTSRRGWTPAGRRRRRRRHPRARQSKSVRRRRWSTGGGSSVSR
jgi:hypothetical protein